MQKTYSYLKNVKLYNVLNRCVRKCESIFSARWHGWMTVLLTHVIDSWACIGRKGGSISKGLGHWCESYKHVIIFATVFLISQSPIKDFHIQMPQGWGECVVSEHTQNTLQHFFSSSNDSYCIEVTVLNCRS